MLNGKLYVLPPPVQADRKEVLLRMLKYVRREAAEAKIGMVSALLDAAIIEVEDACGSSDPD